MTITEKSYDNEDSDAIGTIDSSIAVKQKIYPQNFAVMPDSSQTARAMALIAYDKVQVSKSTNLTA